MADRLKALINRREVRVAWQGLTKTDQVNVNESERLGSLLFGLVSVLYGLMRLRHEGLVFILGGAYLLYRGLTGHCPLYELAHYSTASRTERLQFRSASARNQEPVTASTPAGSINLENPVDEVAWETFPASDAPAWTAGR